MIVSVASAEVPTMAEEKDIFDLACETLRRYYLSLGKQYEEGKFMNWCDQFGIDEGLFISEMNHSAKKSMIADFDEDTPFPWHKNDLTGLDREKTGNYEYYLEMHKSSKHCMA